MVPLLRAASYSRVSTVELISGNTPKIRRAPEHSSANSNHTFQSVNVISEMCADHFSKVPFISTTAGDVVGEINIASDTI